MEKQSKIEFKDLALIAKIINLKIKETKHASTKNFDEKKELEKGYATARSAMVEYSFE